MAKAIVYLPSPSCQIKSSTPHHEPSSRHIKILSEPISRRGPPFTFSLFSSQMPTHFSISKSMAHWINLSPLCVAMTRQSSDFMAEWISVIKETTSKTICLSHPSVIAQRSPSAAHHSKTTASHGERAARAGCIHHNAFRERERWRDREVQKWELGVWVKLNEGNRVKRQSAGTTANTTRKRKRQMEILCCFVPPISEPNRWCCPVVPTDV